MRILFEEHIKNHFPHLYESKLLVAVSGGLDSVVLVHLCKNAGLDIAIAHCNFKLRGEESDGDEDFVESLGEHLGVHTHRKSFNVSAVVTSSNLSVQMAARELRYKWFDELSSEFKYTYILTAHHLDDAIETFFINLSRGTGIEGLTGIPESNARVERPLLTFTRLQLEMYARENNILWREDQSNQELTYLRNKIRHTLVPVLKEINPDFSERLRDTQQYLRGTTAILTNHIEGLKEAIFSSQNDITEVSISKLLALQPLEAYLYEIFKEYKVTSLKDLRSLLNAQSGKQIRTSTHRIIKDRNRLLISRLEEENIRDEVYHWPETLLKLTHPLQLSFRSVQLPEDVKDDKIFVDKETLKFPLVVRKWKNGDYFYPVGMQGKKKLSKFFKDEKYSLLEKESQWLLCSEDEVIWIIGKRADRRFLATLTSKEIVEIRLDL